MWMDIAEKDRATTPRAPYHLTWRSLPDAPHTVGEARALVDAGLADMCQRHEENRIVLCVRMRSAPDKRRMPFFKIKKIK